MTDDINPLGDVFVIVSEHDHHDTIHSRGSIAFETHTGEANLFDAIKRAENIGNKYGNLTVCKLVPVGDVEYCRELINQKHKEAQRRNLKS